jgi:RNA polymerase sigma-70 factor (ECF subfamily)
VTDIAPRGPIAEQVMRDEHAYRRRSEGARNFRLTFTWRRLQVFDTHGPCMKFFGRASHARFDELYVRFGPAIYARCRHMLNDRGAAEDITQETFLLAHRDLAKLRSDREALAWLYRTATNRCLNEIRNGRHRAAAPKATEESIGVIEASDGGRARALDEGLLDRDLVARLAARLPEDLITAAWLYHVDGHDQAEIAEICGVSRRTVIARLERFASQARALLGEGTAMPAERRP